MMMMINANIIQRILYRLLHTIGHSPSECFIFTFRLLFPCLLNICIYELLIARGNFLLPFVIVCARGKLFPLHRLLLLRFPQKVHSLKCAISGSSTRHVRACVSAAIFPD